MAAALMAASAGCGAKAAAPFTQGNGGDDSEGASDAGAGSLGEADGDIRENLDASAGAADGASNGFTNVDGGECQLGAAGSFATNDSLNLFGDIVYYNDGGALPKGRYRVKYVDGCMKYDFVFAWQVQAQAPDAGDEGFWLVGNATSDRVAMPPAAFASYPNFDDCVDASLAVPATEFDFDGGKLGVWLNDTPYQDNVAGENGRNPKWQLTLLQKCPPNLGIN